jgi:hypothetical protein
MHNNQCPPLLYPASTFKNLNVKVENINAN